MEKILVSLAKDFEKTKQIMAQLAENGLLVEKPLAVRPKKGSPRQLTGFNVIDTDRLGSLDGDTLSGLMRSGALMIVYAHLVSLTNLEDGWITQSISKEPRDKSEAPDIEALFGGGGDIFRSKWRSGYRIIKYARRDSSEWAKSVTKL